MRRTRLATERLCFIVLLAVIGVMTMTELSRAQDGWKPAAGHIMTRWAKNVTPENVWQEYPRPTMAREKWMNLNGLWSYAVAPQDRPQPAQAGSILVPFPIESALSGVDRALEPAEALWYWRTFSVPADWKYKRVLLHFGAVDWDAKISVNGRPVGEHQGGYDGFSFDVTGFLNGGNNELRLEVTDPTDTGGQPRGKQWLKPGGIWYRRTSGIWQTVWLEPLPRKSIDSISVDANPTTGHVRIAVKDSIVEANDFFEYEAEVFLNGKRMAINRSKTSPCELDIPQPKSWSPDEPVLYDVTVRAYLGEQVADEVKSYFAFRDIKVAPDENGVNRLMLNGKPVFQYGPLDQGFWPDGLYTPPTDEAMKFDIEAVKKMGGNMLRKHVKVESERFYYWCDKLGIMVWQDMPSPFFRGVESKDDLAPLVSDEWKANFEKELRALIAGRKQHPSIVMWVPFNEGWGQNDLAWCKKMAELCHELDPTRLVNNASGWTDMHVGDVADLHSYPGPAMPPTEKNRASVLGEFGGLGLPTPGHVWIEKNNWGYVTYKNNQELTDAYVALMEKIPLFISQGLCAAVYTQTTDVEIECNGWLTYDREVWKIDPARAEPVTRKLYGPLPSIKVVVPTALQGKQTWRYTTDTPAAGWFNIDFNDAAWKSGDAGFGTKQTPGAVVGTDWHTGDIWIRRTFELTSADFQNPHLVIHHDEDAEVYINGTLAGAYKRWTDGYAFEKLSPEAAKLFKAGKNTLAVHCHQTNGGQNIDVGVSDLVAPRGEPKPAPKGDGDKPAKPSSRREDINDYDTRTLAGFTLKINRELTTNDPALLDRVLVQLAADLDEVTHFVPAPALETLRGVTIWVERQGSSAMGWGGHGMCCHWSPNWLASQGLLTEKAGGVEIINPQDFLTWRRDQPYMAFHELSHAYHWQLAKLDPEIDAAYQHAMKTGIYDKVARNSLPEGKTEKAYAATNSHEYFAELSEAYFALNDFYPYTRRQLAVHDPDGLKLIARLWNLSADEIKSRTGEREAAARNEGSALLPGK